jgi:hypothetical protein
MKKKTPKPDPKAALMIITLHKQIKEMSKIYGRLLKRSPKVQAIYNLIENAEAKAMKTLVKKHKELDKSWKQLQPRLKIIIKNIKK